MNDLSILHLSDLHIDGTSTNYSRLLAQLILDIKNEIQHIKDNSLLVVVTGDILHQGPSYLENSNAYNNAIKFFKVLRKHLANKVVGIFIVAGNHDKRRTDNNSFLIPAYRSLPISNKDKNGKPQYIFNKNFYKNFWKFHIDTYDKKSGTGYIELTKEIYALFGMPIENIETKSFISDTFGVDIVEILGRKYCFIMLNTSWSCFDDADNRNILLGDFQIQKIKEQFQLMVESSNEDERPEITFVLGHHPVGVLRGEEEDQIFNEMISFDSFDANVYLCGHTHDRTVNNWVNNRHSINTFVTGIGWPEKSGGSHVGNHTYSIYVFNLDANSVDVYVRSTNDSGSFSPDFRIYTSNRNIESQKLVFPIKAQNAQTYIPLSVGGNLSSKAYYISDSFIKSIKDYVKKIEKFRSVVGAMIESDKNDLFIHLSSNKKIDENRYDEYDTISESNQLLYNYFLANIPNEPEEVQKEISQIFSKNANLLFEVFLGFLQKICQKMQQIFVGDLCDDTDIVRFHFRYLADRKTLQYLRLCTSYPENIDPSDYDLSEIKYGQLIEQSNLTGQSLIYSVNEEFTDKKISTKWTNFITVVPLFEKNVYTRRNTTNIRKIPFITFGVTINNEKFDDLLYCMDYFSIKETIEEIVEYYLEIFHIDMDSFCTWAKKTLENRGNANE